MSLQEKIVQEMRSTTDKARRDVLKVLVAEFQRGISKEISDEKVVKIIKACIKNDAIMKDCARTEQDKEKFIFSIHVLDSLIPVVDLTSIEVVRQWVIDNVDFSKLPNKVEAMKIVMQEFKGKVDGNEVKAMLQEM